MYQLQDEGCVGRSGMRPADRQDAGIDSAWLHDNVLQVLEYVATDGFGTGGDPSALRRLAAQAADDLRGAIDERPARAVSGDLPDLLTDAVRRTAGLSTTAVELDLDEANDPVPGAIASAVADAVGAALANVHRHAHARVALVRCVTTPGHVVASVTDDGTGFDVGSTPEGIGLRRSLRERIARIGGRVIVASAPGSGTIVRIAVGREPRAEVVA